MPKRLTERFPTGTVVEIEIVDFGWLTGIVVQHESPAVWVRTEGGQYWFVTNGRKIRNLQRDEDDDVHDID